MKVIEKHEDGSVTLNLKGCKPENFKPYQNMSHCFIQPETENGEKNDNIELITRALNSLNRI